MTENERLRIGIAAHLLQDIRTAMYSCDMKTGIKNCVRYIQEERTIPTLKLTENGDLLRIDIPEIFRLDFDLNEKVITIQLAKREVMMPLPESDVRSITTAHHERLKSLVSARFL